MDKKKIYIVSTSHFDMEWYFSFERFRIIINHAIDSAVGLLDNNQDYSCFMLDGQTNALKAYLEIYPEREEKLAAYLKEKRLAIGPWFVQPDVVIPSGESLIRNLYKGIKDASEYGGTMKMGYLPDCFGHISQMPQIYNGFGIDTAFLMRGVTWDETKREFIWESPDGSSVLTVTLPYGYGVIMDASNMIEGISVVEDEEKFYELIEKVTEKKEPIPTNPYTLIYYGSDHCSPSPNLMEMVRSFNRKNNEYEIIFIHPDKYFDIIKKEQQGDYQVKKGELRKGNDIFYLKDTLSARNYIKRENFISQQALVQKAEPFSVLAWILGKEYPHGYLNKAWENLLLNHTHDGICGCSINLVHDEMMTRFKKAQEICYETAFLALNHIQNNIDTGAFSENGHLYTVFNSHYKKISSAVEITLKYPGKELPYYLKILDDKGNELPAQILEMKVSDRIESNFKVLQRFYQEVTCRILVHPGCIPAYGYKTVQCIPEYRDGAYREKLYKSSFTPFIGCALKRTMENEYVKLNVNNDGTLDVFNKETGISYKGVHYFLDDADAGDTYNYMPAAVDAVFDSRSLKWDTALVSNGISGAVMRLTADFYLPEGLEENQKVRSSKLVKNSIVTEVTLLSGKKYVKIHTTIDNQSKDHRLRAFFPTSIATEISVADSAFSIEKRGIKDPNRLHPLHSFVELTGGNESFSILTRGIHQYEQLQEENGTIALTLLKCQSLLYRSFLHKDENFSGAQCQGMNTFDYAILTGGADEDGLEAMSNAREFCSDILCIPASRKEGQLPSEFGFIELVSKELVLTAVKKAEKEDGFIVRLFNATGNVVNGTLNTYFPVREAYALNLNEERLSSISIDKGIKIDVPPYKIISVLFK